jgi:DNA polymerase-2
MTYGRVVYQAGARTLFGRLHIDRKNSFTTGHTGLHGLYEIARVAKIPIQRAARCTIGTSLSSMQHDWAVRHDVLVPLDKGQTEDFRPAEDLIAADRGGLVYEPELGFHEDVIEFDFASMYPEVMVRHNITPEAVNCACCFDNKVPGLKHHLCRTRGMVLEPIVKKRAAYKKLIKAGHPDSQIFKGRYDAFKWALVCCFGYLGFRNARFGRIEAHECVNAYGREALLRAKEIAEADGFHFLHAIVDSLWLTKDGATNDDVERLRQKIETATGLPMALEGRYRWIRFCESKQKKGRGVPNRYFGAFHNGELKFRGIELRRHDTPLLIKALQQELLDVMAKAEDLPSLRALAPRVKEIVDEYDERLRLGMVTPMELAISKHLRQAPEDYMHDTLSALAAKKMAAAGITLHPGETISYIVTEEKDKVKDWRVMPLALIDDTFEYDVRYYQRLIRIAADVLTVGLDLLPNQYMLRLF